MSMTRREFLEELAAASVSDMALDNRDALAALTRGNEGFYCNILSADAHN
jgi:hypothetical protein